jgi:hypothetical protein
LKLNTITSKEIYLSLNLKQLTEDRNISGGAFEYNQFRLQSIAEDIRLVIDKNFTKDEWGYCTNYSPITLARLQEVAIKLDELQTDVHKIDYMLSGDIGEDSLKEYFNNKESDE